MKYWALGFGLSWCIVVHAFASQPLGRLFYTPQQRQLLDHPSTPLPRRTPNNLAPDTHYNGYVMRSDGVNTVWVNGRERYVDQPMASSGQLKLSATPALKPGQIYNRQMGQVQEGYQIAPSEADTPPAPPSPPPLTLPITPLAGDEDDAAVKADHAAPP